MADFGRIAWLAAGEPEGALAKGLLRRCVDPAPLKAMIERPHQQQLALWDRRMVCRTRRGWWMYLRK